MNQLLNLEGKVYEFHVPNTLDGAEREYESLKIDINELQAKFEDACHKGRKSEAATLKREIMRLSKHKKLVNALLSTGRTRVQRNLAETGIPNSSKILEDTDRLLFELYKVAVDLHKAALKEDGSQPQLSKEERGPVINAAKFHLESVGYFQLIGEIESGETPIEDALSEANTKDALKLISSMQKECA